MALVKPRGRDAELNRMGFADDVGAAFLAHGRAVRRRRAATRLQRHPIGAGLWRDALNAFLVAITALFLLAAAAFAVLTFRMLTDDLVWVLGTLLMPVALGGVFSAVGALAWAIRFARLP